MGEFGRAPKVAVEPNFAGNAPGRKHWASAYSIMLAGAGVKRGAVVGKTDRLGAEVATERYAPWDVAALTQVQAAPHEKSAIGRPCSIL